MTGEQMTEEPQPPDEPPVTLVYLTADCGCRFQVVSGLPVLNAGVLSMPDVLENVCDTHRAKQEEAQEAIKARMNAPKIVDTSGRTIVSSHGNVTSIASQREK